MSQSSWDKDKSGFSHRASRITLNDPMHFLLVIILLAALIGSVWYFVNYEPESVLPSSGHTVIRAEAGPFRVRPPNYGKIDIQHQDKQIYATLEDKTAAQEKFQSRPENNEQPLFVEPPSPPVDGEVQPALPQQEITPPLLQENHQSNPEGLKVSLPVQVPAANKLMEKAAENPPTRGDLSKQGVNWVRLATLPNYDGALKEWERIQKMFPEIFGSKQASIAVINLESGGRLYPIYIGPYSTPDDAQKVCAEIKNKVGCLMERLLP